MTFYRVKDFIRHWRLLPSAWLLAVQLFILIMTFVPIQYRWYQVTVWCSGVLTLFLIARVIKETATTRFLGRFFIFGAILCLCLLMAGFQHLYIQITSHVFEIGAYGCAIYGLLRYMFADQFLTKDELFAAGAVFTLLAWAFAYAYHICQLVAPNSFSNSLAENQIESWLNILFYSFSLQSATGLSHLLPMRPAVKVISIVQMFVSVMYIAIVVSRLFSLREVKYVRKHKKRML